MDGVIQRLLRFIILGLRSARIPHVLGVRSESLGAGRTQTGFARYVLNGYAVKTNLARADARGV
ncbi:hypothetical protein [Yersinia ruckeri]|uniref:hypothetical protein n=1 Tax=Yersinia ruckeri TaxID=29486 RepID=UPI000B000BE9|nr:hypothetical protein [Yersinia ruckeri]EKN4690403.1 hypothetical protein [Yersinia ruckeri]EKN4694276.1 hypothetical protein [Yersinia ruckeri]MCW6650974.1 hypothetical protein [Yersinia ruckeri]